MSLKFDQLKSALEPLGYSRIYADFLIEANLFANFISNCDLKKVLADFNDFNQYLSKHSKKINANTKVAALSNGSNILRLENAAGELKSILDYAHFSACCELFNGWILNFTGDTKHDIARFLEHNLSHLKAENEQELNNVYLRIATADTVRVMTLLKLLGVLQPDTSNKNVLSYGAASGVKELYATHTEPKIDAYSNRKNKYEFQLKFSRKIQWPTQTVLIDYDTHWKEHYENITANHDANVLGILQKFDNAIMDIPELLSKNNMELVTLVLGWRIDHQIIPDVNAFFKQLLPTLSSRSRLDFIVTIGAGDDDKDYAGRVHAMDNIWDFLKQHKLNPVRIILNSGSRDTPLFGDGSYATYEVIYCQLHKKNLNSMSH